MGEAVLSDLTGLEFMYIGDCAPEWVVVGREAAAKLAAGEPRPIVAVSLETRFPDRDERPDGVSDPLDSESSRLL